MQRALSSLSPFLLNTSPLGLSSGVAERVTFRASCGHPALDLGFLNQAQGLRAEALRSRNNSSPAIQPPKISADDVLLDPNTVNPILLMSDDQRSLQRAEECRNLPDSTK